MGCKVACAYKCQKAKSRLGGYTFFAVYMYLLYPGESQICFSMLSCRAFDGDASVLSVDYGLAYSEVRGDESATRETQSMLDGLVWDTGLVIGRILSS